MRDRGMEGLSAKHFPAMVVSTIAGKVAKTFQLKGFNSMIVEGIASGLHALVHGYHRLQQDDSLDALVVIAGDEMASLGINLYESLGALSHNGFSPYGILNGEADDVIESHVEDAIAAGTPETAFAGGSGMVPGEGGAAVVLERRTSAERRGVDPLARVSGTGLTSSGAAPFTADGLHRSAKGALDAAGADADAVDAVYGHGRGSASYDGLEVEALRRLFDGPVAAGCVNGHTGVVEATSGLYSTIASVGSLQHDEVYPLVSDGEVDASAAPATFSSELRTQGVDRVLVLGGTEGGINASVVLEAA
jgi:3-oxoacyl-(acyl-carrier-protein) synthase